MQGRWFREVVLVRHCESVANEKLMKGEPKKVEQDADVPLTELGKVQATVVQKVIEKLMRTDFPSSLVCSPALRTVMTAPPGTVTDLDLRERNVKHDYVFHTGETSVKETHEEFCSRVDKYLQLWAQKPEEAPQERHIVVTHSLWIQEFLRALFKGDHYFSMFHNGNGSITVVQFTEDENKVRRAEIQTVGSVYHLPPALRTGHHHELYY